MQVTRKVLQSYLHSCAIQKDCGMQAHVEVFLQAFKFEERRKLYVKACHKLSQSWGGLW